jgi:hypothetical protein
MKLRLIPEIKSDLSRRKSPFSMNGSNSEETRDKHLPTQKSLSRKTKSTKR